MPIARESLASTTTVSDALAYTGSNAWAVTNGHDMAGVALLKALVYQFQTKVENALNLGANTAGVDLKWYASASGAYVLFDESTNRVEFKGDVDLRLDGSSASNYWFWDAGNNRVRSVGKVDMRYVGSTSTMYCEWDASNNIFNIVGGADVYLEGSSASNHLDWDASDNELISTGKVDLKIVMSGTSLDKRDSRNQFMVDASANVLKLLGYLEVSTVGPSTAVPGEHRLAFYLTGANSIGVKWDSGGGVYRYGSLVDSSSAY